jgi:predicted ester cyclase
MSQVHIIVLSTEIEGGMEMSEKENKERFRQLLEEFNSIKGDLSRLNTWLGNNFSPKIIFHSAEGDMNFEQVKQFYTELVSAFNPVCTVKHLIAEGDMVVSHFYWSGIHQGISKGIPATGKKVNVGLVLICKVSGGKSEEVWSYQDTLGLMSQLGVIPSPVTAK